MQRTQNYLIATAAEEAKRKTSRDAPPELKQSQNKHSKKGSRIGSS
jgi:hypothetical protein